MDKGAATEVGKGLNIAHLNVRSIMGGHKFEMVRNQIEKSNIDVFTISESWLSKAVPDRVIECMNYNVVRLDRGWSETGNDNALPKRGGGLLNFIRSDLKYSDTKYEQLNVSCKDIEMLWVALEIKNMRSIVVVTIYRPPQGDSKRCNKLLNEAFEKANLKDNAEIFLLGDFNINYRDKKASRTKELEFTARSLGLSQIIKADTRISRRNDVMNGSQLDLIFTNSDHVADAKTLDYNISDHLAILVTRKKKTACKEKAEFFGRSYKNYVREDFQETLSTADWEQFFESREPNLLWEIMEGEILRQANKTCPIKKLRVNARREPWVTNEAIEAIRDKDNLLKRAKRTDRVEDWEAARRVRNRVGRDLENLRADFLKRQQEDNKNDPKKFWKNIASIFPGKKGNTGRIWLKDSASGNDIEQANTANYINTFFTNIGPDLAKKHDKRWEYFGVTVQDNIQGFGTELAEVTALCKQINTMKSSGIDELSSRLCKDAFMVLGRQLVHLFNCSLSTGIFPNKWKIGKIIPLFKGGDRENVNNYRPVSLLPLPGKLLEKIVHNKIVKFWEDSNFLSEDQGGFRKNHSTVSTVASLTDDLFHQINEGNTTVAAFVDLRKAFDTVNTKVLTNNLTHAGIRGDVLKWCNDYLSNRSQCTFANNIKSTLLPVTCGVPQGSVLGPLFFLVYVNDIQNAVGECGIKLYADDTVLYQSGVNCAEAEAKLQSSVSKFKLWCDVNVLTINASKTKVMAFGSRSKVKKCKNLDIRIAGEKLKLVPSFKYLGLTLDSTLNYGQHIATVIKLITYKMTLLAKLKKYLKDDSALQIYKSMLLPYFDYADIIFHKANTKEVGKLQTLQNKCLRICLGRERRFDTNRAHKLAKVPFLEDRRTAHACNFMFKRKDNKSLLNRREIRTRAHDAPLFLVPIPRCEAFKRSVSFYGSSLWNELKVDIRNTVSYDVFKARQKEVMLQPLGLIQ